MVVREPQLGDNPDQAASLLAPNHLCSRELQDLYIDYDSGVEPMNFFHVFLYSQALECVVLSLAKRDELLQFAQGAISGLKINADIARLDNEITQLQQQIKSMDALHVSISSSVKSIHQPQGPVDLFWCTMWMKTTWSSGLWGLLDASGARGNSQEQYGTPMPHIGQTTVEVDLLKYGVIEGDESYGMNLTKEQRVEKIESQKLEKYEAKHDKRHDLKVDQSVQEEYINAYYEALRKKLEEKEAKSRMHHEGKIFVPDAQRECQVGNKYKQDDDE
ncbi:Transcription factor TFIIE alpha subunit [Zea mays]|uniref:Transcription factor TFIIE alpha subunit n=1 Tax=Zea mays TaxID=4577 RepID=A0A1D6GP10_MAIZE|nr:Transcription factor TFIIE alpha subunit [Zea mays]